MILEKFYFIVQFGIYFPTVDCSVKLAAVCVEGQTVGVLFCVTVFLRHSRNASPVTEPTPALTHRLARVRAPTAVALLAFYAA